MQVADFEAHKRKRTKAKAEPQEPPDHPYVVNYLCQYQLYVQAQWAAVMEDDMPKMRELLDVLALALEEGADNVILDDDLFRRIKPGLTAFAEGHATTDMIHKIHGL